jgi:hypothetical protein
MALAQSMKNFVEDLRASRRSRHGFVKGNREIAKSIMAENRKFLQNIRMQNKVNAQQTHAFLKSAKETRMENYKKAREVTKETLDRIHQSKEAIRQGAQEMMKELREDNQMAHKYWLSLSAEDPVIETKTATTTSPQVAKKPETQSGVVNEVGPKEVKKVDKETEKTENKKT